MPRSREPAAWQGPDRSDENEFPYRLANQRLFHWRNSCCARVATIAIPTTRELVTSQARCLPGEVIAFRHARRARSRNSIVFDGGFAIAHFLK